MFSLQITLWLNLTDFKIWKRKNATTFVDNSSISLYDNQSTTTKLAKIGSTIQSLVKSKYSSSVSNKNLVILHSQSQSQTL